MLNKGINHHRLEFSLPERIFAELWEEQNTHGRTLDYLLAENNNRPMDEVTDRDRRVAATVIQWLGSLVGDNFLRDVAIRIIEEEEKTKNG